MRRMWLVISGVVIAAVGLFAAGRLLGGGDRLPDIPDGDQELAWIHAATSGATWERFVAGVLRVRHDRPIVQIDDSRAFLDQTTSVPEVVIGLDGAAGRLHIRWYKLTSETDNAYWVRRLAKRGRPPLAFIGGGTSERAYDLAQALAAQKEWAGQPPLLLDHHRHRQHDLFRIGRGARTGRVGPHHAHGCLPRSLVSLLLHESANGAGGGRFSVEPTRSAADRQSIPGACGSRRAGVEPVGRHRLVGRPRHGMFAGGHGSRMGRRPVLDRFVAAISRGVSPAGLAADVGQGHAEHSVQRGRILSAQRLGGASGGVSARRTARRAASAASAGPAGVGGAGSPSIASGHERAPLAGRSLIAVTGDSININNVYRDTDIVWSSRRCRFRSSFLPIRTRSLGTRCACRRSTAPVSVAASDGLLPPNGTDDVLLFRDLVDILVANAYGGTDATKKELVDSPDVLAKRFRSLDPPFFDASGDRRGGRGEYVVALRPQFAEGARCCRRPSCRFGRGETRRRRRAGN